MKAAKQAFAIQSHGAVNRPIAVAVVDFFRRKFLSLAVNGRRGGIDNPLDLSRYRGFEDVKCPGGQNLVREARILCTLGYPDGGFVKDGIDPLHDLADKLTVANITYDTGELAGGGNAFEVLAPPFSKIVQHNNLLVTFSNQAVGNMRADQSGPSCYESALMIHATF
jgi:hypothetical protein